MLGGQGGCSGSWGRRAGWYDDKTFALSFRRGSGARGPLDVQPKGLVVARGEGGERVARRRGAGLGSRLLSGARGDRAGVWGNVSAGRKETSIHQPHPHPLSPPPPPLL